MIETGIGHCWLKFNNGYTLSIFNGYGSYSENNSNFKLKEEMITKRNPHTTAKSKDCEIAIIYENNFVTHHYLDCNGDTVKGRISFEELLDIINYVRNLK